MSATRAYSRLHRAMLEVAREHDLVPMDVRLLFALAERDGTSTTDVLADDMCMWDDGTAIRRSLLVIRPQFCIGGDKRGSRVPISLTEGGWQIANAVQSRLIPDPLEVAAEQERLFDEQLETQLESVDTMRTALHGTGL